MQQLAVPIANAGQAQELKLERLTSCCLRLSGVTAQGREVLGRPERECCVSLPETSLAEVVGKR